MAQQRVPDVFYCQMLAKRVLREVALCGVSSAATSSHVRMLSFATDNINVFTDKNIQWYILTFNNAF